MKSVSILMLAVSLSGASRVQFQSGSASPGKSVVLTMPSATASGNELIVAMSDYYASSQDGESFSVSDSYSNTWQKAVDYQPGGRIIVFYAESIKGGMNHQITLTASPNAAYLIGAAVEYSGLSPTGSLDVVATNRATGTTYTSGQAITTQPNELLFGVHHVHSTGVTFSPVSPWSQVMTAIGSPYHEQVVQDQFVTAAGGYASTGTESSNQDTISVLVAFKQAPSVPWNLAINCLQTVWMPGTGSKGTGWNCILTSNLPAPVGGSFTFTFDPSTVWQYSPSPVIIPAGATSAPFTATGL